MQRVLPSDEIAHSAPQPVPRLRLPSREIFAQRAARIGQLAADHPLADYLRLMQGVVSAQHVLLAAIAPSPPSAHDIARAAAHRMPILPASDHRRHEWHALLVELGEHLIAQGDTPTAVRTLLTQLRAMPAAALDAQADALLALRTDHIDIALAPFLMAALQVRWVALASALSEADVPQLDVAGVCPVCGSLPVASIVRIGKPYEGYRYLHCVLCATEWHRVRARCSHCDAVDGVTYRFIDGGNDVVRAETCEQCRTYRKILYQEKDPQAEPLADDLASVALDLLVAESGYHRANANPLLWQRAGD